LATPIFGQWRYSRQPVEDILSISGILGRVAETARHEERFDANVSGYGSESYGSPIMATPPWHATCF
jgi:hypothetical protein